MLYCVQYHMRALVWALRDSCSLPQGLKTYVTLFRFPEHLDRLIFDIHPLLVLSTWNNSILHAPSLHSSLFCLHCKPRQVVQTYLRPFVGRPRPLYYSSTSQFYPHLLHHSRAPMYILPSLASKAMSRSHDSSQMLIC